MAILSHGSVDVARGNLSNSIASCRRAAAAAAAVDEQRHASYFAPRPLHVRADNCSLTTFEPHTDCTLAEPGKTPSSRLLSDTISLLPVVGVKEGDLANSAGSLS